MAQSIRIPVELELKNMQSAISSLKSALSGVSKNSGIYTELSREIDKVDKKFKELSATASRPFNNTGSISSFENQFLKLGDRVTEIGRAFGELNFKHLDLSSIPGAQKDFEELEKKVREAQTALDSIGTNKMKDMLAVDTSGLSQAFSELSKFNKGLLNGNSFEETFANLSAKAAELKSNISNTTAEIERFKNANAQSEAQLGFLDEIKTKLAEFKPGELISFDSLAEKMKTTAQSAGLTPEVLLNMLGLNKEGLYTGTADQIQKKLSNAISSRASSISRGIGSNTAKITGLDSSLTGLQNYVNAVTEAQNQLNNLMNNSGTQKQIAEAEQVLKSAEAEYKNFVETLLKTSPAAKNAGNSVNSAGSAMTGMSSKAASARAELDRLNNTANKLSQMKSRLAYFFSFYKIMGTIKRVVNEATTTIRDLDKVMTEISVVTKMTQEDLWNQVEAYSAIANEYAVSIKGVYEVSQLYYQQGLQTNEVMQLTTETLKMAKIAGLEYSTATDYMTVAIRGFKMEMEDASRVTDVYSALAANTASNTEELAIAMSKTASSAEAVGSSFESTSAMIATMVATTREAPENIGSAMKSIISRYGEMTSDPTKLVDSEGEDLSLNRVDKALQSVGITLQNTKGEFRDFDDVILELSKSWDTIDKNTQRYIATTMAGNRQQSRFLALVGNYEEYSRALEIANDSEGTGAQQTLKTMDSLESKITNVKTAWQQFYTSMGLEDMFKGVLGVITQIINNINKMSKFDALVTFFNLFKALKGIVMGAFAGIASQFSQIKNLAQDALKPLQEKQTIQVDTSQSKTQIQTLHDLLVKALTQELNLNTSSANSLIESLGVKVKGITLQPGVTPESLLKSSTSTQLLGSMQSFNWGGFLSKSGNGNAAINLQSMNSFIAGGGAGVNGSNKWQQGALNSAFGQETALRDAFINDFRSFVSENGQLKEQFKGMNPAQIGAEYTKHLQGMSKAELEALINKHKSNADNKNADANTIAAKKNFAQKMQENSAGWRVAAQALNAAGAALTTFALTLKDTSDAAVESSKVASGGGALLSGLGGAVSGALLGANAGPYGALIGAIAGGAAGIISGVRQMVDGFIYTTVERLENAEKELKDLQDEKTRKKATSSGYASALSELEDLKDAQYDSAEAAQEYKDKMNTLAESYPELVTSMDSAGNAIIDIENLEQLLAEARLATAQATSETLEKELQIAELNKKRAKEAIETTSFVETAKITDELTGFTKEIGEIKSVEDLKPIIDFFANENIVQDSEHSNISIMSDSSGTLTDILTMLQYMEIDENNNLINKETRQKYSDLFLNEELFSDFLEQFSNQIIHFGMDNIDYSTPNEFNLKNKDFVTGYLKEVKEDLENSNFTFKDLNLEDEYAEIEEDFVDGVINDTEAFIELFTIKLPNALSAQVDKANTAVSKGIVTLSENYALEEVTEKAVNNGEYEEILNNYSGIYKTLGGKMIEDEFKKAQKADQEGTLTLEDWKKTADFDIILKDLNSLRLSDYENLAEVWDNMSAYNPTKFKEALTDLGLDAEIIDLIVSYYAESLDYTRELAHKQIVKSKVGNTAQLQDLTNTFGKQNQAPSELMDDINDTVQAADKFYEQGMTARAKNLISVAETFYTNAANLGVEDYLEVRSIIDELDLTSLEDLTEAKASIEAINKDKQYDNLLDSIDAAIENCSQNIATLAQAIVEKTITTIEEISETINGFKTGIEAKEALDAYKKLNSYKGLLEDKNFNYFFEYDDALGKWVYTSQGMSDIIAAQVGEIEESNLAIDKLIQKSKSEVKDILGLDAEGYVKTAEDYYDEDTETYSKAWTKLSAEDQAYREWARNTQEQEGLGADVSKQAYIDYLIEQGEAGKEAANLLYEQLIYSLGDTLDFEKIVTGAIGDSGDRQRAIDTAAEMVKTKFAKSGKTLNEEALQNWGKEAIQALEAGNYALYESITGDNLSDKEIADLATKKTTSLSDAVKAALTEVGTVIDKTTYDILNNAGIADDLGIEWNENGYAEVVREATNFVDVINEIATAADLILSEKNATLASLYEKSYGADKASKRAGLIDKTSVTFNDLADLATVRETTLNTLFDQDTARVMLSGLKYNDFTGEFDIVNFDAYWTAVTGSLEKNTVEYLEAYSAWVEDYLEKTNKVKEEAQTQLDDLLDASFGEKVNVAFLDAVVPNLQDYVGTINNGIAEVTENTDFLGLLQRIEGLEASGVDIVEDSVGELRDAIVELIQSWADSISDGLKGELDFTGAEKLKAQFGLTDADFTKTTKGLQLSRDTAYQLYLELKKIAPMQAELVFDSIAESLSEAGDEYEDVASTMKTISKINDDIADVPVDTERREELERELEVAEKILRVRSQEGSNNFMEKDLPSEYSGPLSAWEGINQAFGVLDGEDFSKGRIGVQDFYNMVTWMGDEVLRNAGILKDKSQTAADLISASGKALVNVDGETFVDLSKLGTNFNVGAEGMKDGLMDGIRTLAESQIDILDAEIALLETIVQTQEAFDSIDGEDGIIDLSEIEFFGKPSQTWSKEQTEVAEAVETYVGDVVLSTGHTIRQAIGNPHLWNNLTDADKELVTKLTQTISEIFSSEDWSSLLDGSNADMLQNKINEALAEYGLKIKIDQSKLYDNIDFGKDNKADLSELKKAFGEDIWSKFESLGLDSQIEEAVNKSLSEGTQLSLVDMLQFDFIDENLREEILAKLGMSISSIDELTPEELLKLNLVTEVDGKYRDKQGNEFDTAAEAKASNEAIDASIQYTQMKEAGEIVVVNELSGEVTYNGQTYSGMSEAYNAWKINNQTDGTTETFGTSADIEVTPANITIKTESETGLQAEKLEKVTAEANTLEITSYSSAKIVHEGEIKVGDVGDITGTATNLKITNITGSKTLDSSLIGDEKNPIDVGSIGDAKASVAGITLDIPAELDENSILLINNFNEALTGLKETGTFEAGVTDKTTIPADVLLKIIALKSALKQLKDNPTIATSVTAEASGLAFDSVKDLLALYGFSGETAKLIFSLIDENDTITDVETKINGLLSPQEKEITLKLANEEILNKVSEGVEKKVTIVAEDENGNKLYDFEETLTESGEHVDHRTHNTNALDNFIGVNKTVLDKTGTAAQAAINNKITKNNDSTDAFNFYESMKVFSGQNSEGIIATSNAVSEAMAAIGSGVQPSPGTLEFLGHLKTILQLSGTASGEWNPAGTLTESLQNLPEGKLEELINLLNLLKQNGDGTWEFNFTGLDGNPLGTPNKGETNTNGDLTNGPNRTETTEITSAETNTTSETANVNSDEAQVAADKAIIEGEVEFPQGNDNSSGRDSNNTSNTNTGTGEGQKVDGIKYEEAIISLTPFVDAAATQATESATALSTIGEEVSSAATSSASEAASGVQQSFDNIKVPTPRIRVIYPESVSIGVNYSISVSTTSTGPGTVKGRISNVSAPGLNSYGANSASGSLAKGNVSGSALASGSRKTLMGELGPELVVSNGHYFVVGQNGAEFVDLANDAIVFNHLQTQRLLNNGHAGTGKPVTNERKATSLATGNVGPAMASASDALAQLRQIRAMWQAMLDASAQDLGSKAGSGGGGGGGGGGGEDVKAVTGELERWYNLLRQIESLEQHITLEQAKRANMQSGYNHVDSLEKELEMLKEQQKAYEMLAKLQKDYYDRRREDLLSTDYSKIFTYTEHGLMQYVDGENRGLDVLAKLNERDASGKLVNNAKNAKTQIAYLKSIGFNTSILKNNEDGTTAKTEEEMMENFWAGVDGWMEELDGLYDSYHEATTNFEESTEKMNEILQEYIDNQLSVEQKLMQAIQDREQAEIDRIQDEKDALEEAAQSYIDGLSEALSKEQDMYSKNETNAETQKLQRQLAILQRSGGSASEIKSLQDQIDSRLKDAYFEEQQSQIDAIQEASDNQIEKLQTQIDLMTETLEYQKEHGLLWQEVYEMMNQWTPEKMLQFIEQYTKSYEENSTLQNEEDSKETLKELEIFAGKRDLEKREAGWAEYYANAQYDEALKNEHASQAKAAYDEAFASGGASAGEAAANKVFDDAAQAKAEAEKKAQEEAANQPTKTEEPKNQLQYMGGSWQFYSYDKPGGKKGAVFHGKNKSPKVNFVDETSSMYQIEGEDGDGHYFKNRWLPKKYKGKNLWKKYETGGLVDYTGPAWVDGTKSKPEAFLSASDTAMLKSKIFSNSDGSLKSLVAALEKIANDTSRYSGEGSAAIVIENAQVNIQPGVISSDYDARRAGEMALEEMVKIARKTTNRVISR